MKKSKKSTSANQPVPGDLITMDDIHFYVRGAGAPAVVTVREGESWGDRVRAYMGEAGAEVDVWRLEGRGRIDWVKMLSSRPA